MDEVGEQLKNSSCPLCDRTLWLTDERVECTGLYKDCNYARPLKFDDEPTYLN